LFRDLEDEILPIESSSCLKTLADQIRAKLRPNSQGEQAE